MSLYRRGKTWWVRITSPSGERIRKSTGTEEKLKAQQFHDQLKTELWRVHKLGEKPRRSWKEAVLRYSQETSHKASHSEDLWHFKWLDSHLGELFLDEVTKDVLEQLIKERLADGVSNARCNRMLALVRGVLRKAWIEWEWIDRVPKFRMLKEPKRRVRWITREQEDRLVAELPEHLGDVVRFSMATGLRKSNVTELEWDQVDLKRRVAWIHADQAKAGEAIPVPLNADAMVALRRQEGKHERYVFSYKGRR